MSISNKKETAFFLVGDILFFYVSLWVALAIRHLEIPGYGTLASHIPSFSILIVVWLLVFFIAGLYDKHTLVFRRKLPTVLLNTQIANSIIAVFFFYLIPYFDITPKTILFIYLSVSFIFILVWRLYGIKLLGAQKKQKAILIGSGEEINELKEEINSNPRYNLTFISYINLNTHEHANLRPEVLELVYEKNVAAIVIDLNNEKIEPILPSLYNLLFSRVQFLDLHKVYEEVFDRIPLMLINYKWFLENFILSPNRIYDLLKRLMDISASLILGLISLIFYPFVFLAIKLDDGGLIFIKQKRVGQNNKIINIVKFRTMTANDKGRWVVKDDPRITRVGKFLRTTRIDELPQLWNVLTGDLSLVGPRPELPDLVKFYEKEIPYYNVRHLIKPGLSGWGQIHHEKPPHSIEETKEKLSYDLYYIKNRSFLLDLEIALKTIKTIMSRSGV